MKKILIVSIIALMALMPFSMAVNITTFTLSEIVNAPKTNYYGYSNITVHEAWEMLTSTSDGIQVPIDIRTFEEWKQGRIDTPPPESPIRWTNLHLGVGLQDFMEEYAEKQVVVYCRSANRSWTATKLLLNSGFTGTIYHMLGGINAWKNAGYPTISNQPPNTPTIDGPSNGKIGVEYDFKIQTTDPDDDNIYYCVSWGCCGQGDFHTYGPYESGIEVILSHSWDSQGNYIIQAYAKDINEAESDVVTLEISMPRNKQYINTPFLNFLQNHPNLFPILQKILLYLME